MGFKGSYGLTLMMNNNIFDDREIDHQINAGYMFGPSLGIHFGDHQGIQIEYLWSVGRQSFDIETVTPTERIDYDWKTNDLVLLYRYTGYGAFFEIGPKVSFLKEMNREYNTEEEVSANFEDTWYSGVVGFGMFLAGSDLFSLQLGLRFQYQFNDMINGTGKDNNYPVGVNYEQYKSTNLLTAQIQLEANYAFGRIAREHCRDRRKLILFQ